MKRAGGPTSEEVVGAPPAISSDTEQPPKANGGTTMPSSDITRETQTSTSNGAASGKSAPVSGVLVYKNSGVPSKGLSKRWRQPRNVKEFAAQANAVATMLLNEEIDTEKARVYGGVARIVAQAMSTEVSRSRFLRMQPDLELDEEVWEDNDD